MSPSWPSAVLPDTYGLSLYFRNTFWVPYKERRTAFVMDDRDDSVAAFDVSMHIIPRSTGTTDFTDADFTDTDFTDTDFTDTDFTDADFTDTDFTDTDFTDTDFTDTDFTDTDFTDTDFTDTDFTDTDFTDTDFTDRGKWGKADHRTGAK